MAPEPSTVRRTVAGGRFTVGRLLGEGSRKRVYLARDTRLERDVALAVLKKPTTRRMRNPATSKGPVPAGQKCPPLWPVVATHCPGEWTHR